MFIPDPRWEEPNLLIPGKKPTGPVTIDWEHPLAPIATMVNGQGFIGRGSAIPGLTTGVVYGRHAIDQSALGASSETYQEWAKDLWQGPHTILQRSIWWTGSGPTVRVKDTAGFVHWFSDKIDVYRHVGQWDDNITLKAAPNSPFIDPSSEVWINTLHGSDDSNYFSAQSAGIDPLRYGASTAISTRFSTDGIFELVKHGAAIEFFHVFNRSLSADEANYLIRNPYQFLIPA